MNDIDNQSSPEYELPHKRRSPISTTSLTSKKFKLTSPTLELLEKETDEELAKQFKKFTNAPKYDLNSEELFCICRKPDIGEIMVACDGCEEWFHFKCMNVNPELSHLIAKFYCKFCSWKGNGKTLWKRKCRVEGCYEPIRNESKYCSDEHAKEFIRLMVLGGNNKRSVQDLENGVVKDVIDYVNEDHDKLVSLGNKFPELEVVKQYLKDELDLDSFPTDVKMRLQNLSKRSEKVTTDIDQQKKQMDQLVKIKENIKLLNEKLVSLLYPESVQESSLKKKSKKSNKLRKDKIDLCYCDRSIDEGKSLVNQLVEQDELFEKFQNVIRRRLFDNDDELDAETPEEEDKDGGDPDRFMNALCIIDRRKCSRHNGWWNLEYDELSKRISTLEERIELLKKHQTDILRQYSIDEYEKSN